MQSSTGVAPGPAQAPADSPSRVYYRHSIHSLIYVTLDEGNGGIIRNLSQTGAAIQAVGALHPKQQVRMRFDLLNPKARIDVRAEVAWANSGGQAGVRFVEMAPHTRSQLSDWIFVTLLRSIEQASPVLVSPEDADDLILSPSGLPTIRLPRANVQGSFREQPASKTDDTLALAWWPRPVSTRTLAGLMDGLVLFSAVLIFFCMFLSIVHALPPWPVTFALLCGVGGFFTALYWYLFGVMGRGTAGVLLAKLAATDADAKLQAQLREKEARFR